MDIALNLWQDILAAWRPDLGVRMGLSFLVGAILGYEREQHGRAAGFRTTILVCLSACVAMILSQALYLEALNQAVSGTVSRPDPARLAAGVLSGMGFLGAGVIIRQSNHVVRGVTTAATLWFATVIGLSIGAGCLGLGMAATVLAVVVLYLLPWVETCILNDWYADLTVSFDSRMASMESIQEALEALGIRTKGVGIQLSKKTTERQATFRLKFKKKGLVRISQRASETIASLPGVQDVCWSE